MTSPKPALVTAPAAGATRSSVGPAARRRRVLDPRVLLFVVPALALLAIFRVAPVFYGFYLSLTRWNGISDPVYQGFENYIRMFSDPTLRDAIVNNVLILCVVPIWVLLPLVIAVLIHEGAWPGGLLKVAFVVPALVSPALLGLCFGLLLGLDGPINLVLRGIGLGHIATEWLANPATVLWTVSAVLIYSSFGTGVLFYSAGLASIDTSLTDAAAIDGASWFQRLRYVTAPHLRPVMLFWGVVVIIASTTATFPLIFTLTGGGPGHSTTTIDVYIFQLAFQSQNPAYATAIGVTTFVVVFSVILILFRLSRRRDD